MKHVVWAGLWLLSVALAGCATPRAGCSGQACDRPDSNDKALVIWWPEDMRSGLENTKRPIDFTVVPLRD
ncbi:HrpT family type III secretion system protein [Pseudomonas sp. SDO528_S397]